MRHTYYRHLELAVKRLATGPGDLHIRLVRAGIDWGAQWNAHELPAHRFAEYRAIQRELLRAMALSEQDAERLGRRMVDLVAEIKAAPFIDEHFLIED